jgi:hypothetical protein
MKSNREGKWQQRERSGEFQQAQGKFLICEEQRLLIPSFIERLIGVD